MQTFADTRSWILPGLLLGASVLVGVVAGIDPRLGLAAAMGLAFVTIVMADLTVGLCIYALVAFLAVVPEVGGSFLSFDKVAGGLLALSWLATVAGRKETRRAFVTAHPQFTVILGFFILWEIVSLGWAERPDLGLESAARYPLSAFLFLIVFTAVRTPQHVRWLLGTLVVASTLSGAYGLVVKAPAGSEDRLVGTVAEPNQLAAVLVAAIVISLALAAVYRGKPLLRIAFVGAAGLCLLTHFLTLSRGGLIALGVAMVVAPFVAGRWRAPAIAVGLVTVFSVVGFFGFVANQGQRERVTEVGSGSGRSDIWTVGWRMVQAHPVHGIGVGQFQSSAVHYLIKPGTIARSDLIIDKPKVAHNTYLHILSEMGVIGLIPYLLILGFSLRCMLLAARTFERVRDQGMGLISRALFVGVVGILAADFFYSGQFSKQLWLLLGLGPALLAIAHRAAGAEDESTPGGPPVGPLSAARLEPAPALASPLAARG